MGAVTFPKPIALPILCLASLLLLTVGCATRYTVVMTNGVETTAKGKPKLVKEVTFKDESGKSHTRSINPHYQFTDIEGREMRVPTARVQRIYPTSDKKDEELYYLPNNYRMPPDKRPWYKRL